MFCSLMTTADSRNGMGDYDLTMFITGLCLRSHKIAVLVANTESGSLCVEECMQTVRPKFFPRNLNDVLSFHGALYTHTHTVLYAHTP